MTYDLAPSQWRALSQLQQLAYKAYRARLPHYRSTRMELSDKDKACITSGHCPDCGYRGFVLGPRGGVAINIECGNTICRARFNVTAARTHQIVFAQRIPREEDGGSKWS
jgi:hypothetical protein